LRERPPATPRPPPPPPAAPPPGAPPPPPASAPADPPSRRVWYVPETHNLGGGPNDGQGTALQRGSPQPADGRRRPARRGGEVDARPQGPQRHPGEDHRLAGRHQRWRHHRQGNPPQEPVREH